MDEKCENCGHMANDLDGFSMCGACATIDVGLAIEEYEALTGLCSNCKGKGKIIDTNGTVYLCNNCEGTGAAK